MFVYLTNIMMFVKFVNHLTNTLSIIMFVYLLVNSRTVNTFKNRLDAHWEDNPPDVQVNW